MYQATGPNGKRLHTVAEIAATVGVHRTTVYDYLKNGSDRSTPETGNRQAEHLVSGLRGGCYGVHEFSSS
jgi:DNA invertase Pin-like site-specific DNA recombinase